MSRVHDGAHRGPFTSRSQRGPANRGQTTLDLPPNSLKLPVLAGLWTGPSAAQAPVEGGGVTIDVHMGYDDDEGNGRNTTSSQKESKVDRDA